MFVINIEDLSDCNTQILFYLDEKDIHNIQRTCNYYNNLIIFHKKNIMKNLLNKFNYKLYLSEDNRRISILKKNKCISFTPNIIEKDKWEKIIFHLSRSS